MVDNSSVIFDSWNPWAGNDRMIAPLKSALTLAESTGYLDRYGNTNSDSDRTTNSIREETQGSSPSLRLFSVLKKQSRCREQLSRLNLEIQCRMRDKETGDITHFEELDRKINRIRSLNTHIQSIIDSKDRLINRLQQPFVGDFIRLEAQYHKYASEMLPQIAPLLGDLNTNLENIIWMKSLSLSDRRLDNLLTDLSTALASLQSNFQALCQLRQSITNLYKYQTDSDTSQLLSNHSRVTDK